MKKWSLIRIWILTLKELKKLASKLHVVFCQIRCQTCPYQTCPFKYCYRLSSGAGFRSSLRPSWSPSIFSYTFGGIFLPLIYLQVECCVSINTRSALSITHCKNWGCKHWLSIYLQSRSRLQAQREGEDPTMTQETSTHWSTSTELDTLDNSCNVQKARMNNQLR